jgi:hypothetical protein
MQLQRNYLYHLTNTYLPSFTLLIVGEITLYCKESQLQLAIGLTLTVLLVMYTMFQVGSRGRLTIRQTRQSAEGLQRKRGPQRPKRSEIGPSKVKMKGIDSLKKFALHVSKVLRAYESLNPALVASCKDPRHVFFALRFRISKTS